MSRQTTSEKTYLLRGLPITISDDFDEPKIWDTSLALPGRLPDTISTQKLYIPGLLVVV